jgi:hypothetical protein
LEKPEMEILLGRLGHKWEHTTRMVLTEVGFYDVDWIHMSQDRFL